MLFPPPPPTALCLRKSPHCLLGRKRVGSSQSAHWRKRETLPVLGTEK